MHPSDWLHVLLGWAVLLPLVSFALIVLFGPYMGKAGKGAGLLATFGSTKLHNVIKSLKK